ncbi:MAG: xylulose kinase [Anaerolineae bacterium]|nr:xylulose kinase [Anaerolineae bacterium]
MTRDLVVSLDCSTTACKAIIWDREGNCLAEGRAGLPMLQPRPAWHEQPAETWWQSTGDALRQAIAQVPAHRLAAVCIAHQRETFVAVDRQGHPLHNAILWMDERARPLLNDLIDLYGVDHFQQVTGKRLSGNLTIAKLAWLRQHEPQVFCNAFMFLDVQGYLVQCLTGLYRTSWGSADPMGLFDMHTHQWSAEILAGIDVHPDQLPEVFPPGTILGTVTPEAAQTCHLPAGIPVVAGLGDGQSAGLGINITRPGECYLSLGTSIVSGTFSETYLTSHAFRTMVGGVPGTYLFETVLLGGAYTVKWFVDHFTDQEPPATNPELTVEAGLEADACQVPPGSQGLMLVPYWNSAMNPYWDAAAGGIVAGWKGIHRRPHVYRAILEGIAFEQRLHTTGVEQALDHPIDRYVVVGGGARSDLWCQIIADVTGKPVHRTHSPEAAALGAGILAAGAAGLFPDVRQAAQTMARVDPPSFTPDPARHGYYSRLYEDVYIHLFPALQTYLDRLTEIGIDFA